MSTDTESVLSDFRQPEYTGENRCTPCTVVNVGIAIAFSAIVALFTTWLAPVVLGVSLATIYLRGYLVPGTPELTKRYFPDRVLQWFDKGTSQPDAALLKSTEDGKDIDPEPLLLKAGVLEFTPDGTDLKLTNEFQSEWDDRIEAVRGSEYETHLAQMLSVDENVNPDAIEVRINDRNVTVFQDDTPVAMWTSEAALIADVAAVPLLQKGLPEWQNVDQGVRGQLLYGVRVFLERCPTCSGDLALAEETVESCCRSAEVVTLDCDNCESRLLEVEV